MLLFYAVIFSSLIFLLVALSDHVWIRILLMISGLTLFFIEMWLVELFKDKKKLKIPF